MSKTKTKVRPFGITLLAILVYVVGVITLVRGLVYTGTITIGLFKNPSWAAGNEMLIGIFWIIVALIVMGVGTGLWVLKKSAWFLTTVFTGIGVIVAAAGLTETWITFGAYLILLLYLLAMYKHF